MDDERLRNPGGWDYFDELPVSGADSGSTDRYQIRLAALSDEPGDVNAFWNGDSLWDQMLLNVGRTIIDVIGTIRPGDAENRSKDILGRV